MTTTAAPPSPDVDRVVDLDKPVPCAAREGCDRPAVWLIVGTHQLAHSLGATSDFPATDAGGAFGTVRPSERRTRVMMRTLLRRNP